MGFLQDIVSRQTKYERCIQACKTGDVTTLRSLLKNPRSIETRPVGFTTVRAPIEEDLIPRATAARQAGVVDLLLELFPKWQMTIARHEDAINAGLPVYSAYVKHFPHLPTTAIGDMEYPISMAAVMNDVPFVKFLMSKGADPDTSRYYGQPIMDFLSQEPGYRNVYNTLLAAGAEPGYNHS